jgi:hypothetical protein
MTPHCRQTANRTPKVLAAVASLVLLGILTGCGSGLNPASSDSITSEDNYKGLPFTGKVLAGTTPIIGATVQVYAAGTTGNGSAPTPLLSGALTTNSSGAFSVSSYICPTSTSILYLVATGGQAGTTAPANSGTVLMTSPGTCNTVTSGSAITINELTTVASAYAFSQFLALGAKLGATATNISGIALAAGTLANLVNPATGAAPGVAFPANGTAPTPKLDALANALNACIVGDAASSACSQLYSDATSSATTPSNTLDALLNIVHNPAANIAALYTLSAGSTAFTPVLAAAPSDWTLFVNYTGGGMTNPASVAIDSTGRIWVANYNSVASLFANNGAPVFPNGVTGSGLCNSFGAAVDGSDQVWIANEAGGCGGNTVTVLTSAGAQAAVYSAGGLNFPISVAIDSSEDAWIVDYGDSSLTILTNSGTPLSGPNGYDGVSGSTLNFDFPVAVAVDSKRNGYLANVSGNTVTKVAPDGSSFTSFAVGRGPAAIAVDSADNVWSANYYGDSIGLLTSSGTVLSGSMGYTGGGVHHPQGIAIDGVNNVWAINYRSSINIGDALSELSGASTANPGTALSPATGYGTDAGIVEGYGIAIDAAGNIWTSSYATDTLVEFIGQAAPVKTPLLGPVRVQ